LLLWRPTSSSAGLQQRIFAWHKRLLAGGDLSYAEAIRMPVHQPARRFRRRSVTTCPDFIFANDQHYAYGRFMLDPQGREKVFLELGGIHKLFRRTPLWGSPWDAVWQADLAFRTFIALATKLLPDKRELWPRLPKASPN